MPGEAVFSTKVLDNNELKNSEIKLAESLPGKAVVLYKDENLI